MSTPTRQAPKLRHRVEAIVIQKRFTLGYKMWGHGDTEKEAREDLRKRTEGYYYVSIPQALEPR